MSTRKPSRRQNHASNHAHTHVHANNIHQNNNNHHHHRNPSLSHIHQSATHPSDYESDPYDSSFAPPLSSLPPPPPSRTTDELNLSVLQRHFPSVSAILSISPYTVVYTFNASTSSWEKSGIEGSLFVCQLHPQESAEHRYSVVVLNRLGLNNFEAELREEDDVEITEQFVILNTKQSQTAIQAANGTAKTAQEKIIGLWIFSESAGSTSETRALHGRLIKECAAAAGETRNLAETTTTTTTTTTQASTLAEAEVEAETETEPDFPNGHHSHQVSQATEDSFISGPGPTEADAGTTSFQHLFHPQYQHQHQHQHQHQGYPTHSPNISLENPVSVSWVQSNPFPQQQQHQQYPTPSPFPTQYQSQPQPPPQSRHSHNHNHNHNHYNEPEPYQPGEWHFRRRESDQRVQQITPQPEPMPMPTPTPQNMYQQAFSPPPPPPSHGQGYAPGQQDVLGDLFRRAGLGYGGL
ncbi:MAG: hypothetical protein Q9160_000413 [Pyrenula sp. 1 TL-2023]